MLGNELKLFQRNESNIWTDEYIGKNLLKSHLDEKDNTASRKYDLRINTVNWINNMIKPNSRIIDLGCGPGLYAYELGKLGHTVFGIDINNESIKYANKHSKIPGKIKYKWSNYLKDDIEGKYNAVLMIWCDFGALIPDEQIVLLNRINNILENDGVFIFDIFGIGALKNSKNGKNWYFSKGKDFWNKEPYLMMEETKIFNNTIGKRYIIIDEKTNTKKEYILWDQYYKRIEIKKLLRTNGFITKEINENILDDKNILFIRSEKEK
jgi:SAM-dependent methyltransferase